MTLNIWVIQGVAMVNDTCARCKKAVASAVKCINCGNLYHNGCPINYKYYKLISSKEIECCQANENIIMLKKEELKEIIEQVVSQQLVTLLDEIKCLKQEILNLKNNGLETQNVIKKSYAVAASKEEVLFVKPKNNEDSSDSNKIKTDLIANVDPTSLGGGVVLGKNTKRSGLVVKCDNDATSQKFEEELKIKLGDKYNVIRPVPRRNRIKIKNVHESEYSEEDDCILNKIINQNELTDLKSDLKVIKKFKVIKNKFDILLEFDSDSYMKIKAKEKINIGWSRCYYVEDYSIIRCYKCSKYGHQAKECKGDAEICPKCAQNHSIKNCNSDQLCCINCTLANKKLGLKLETNHEVWSTKCVSLSKLIESQKKKYYGGK